MVQVASLRIQIEANQAKQAAADVRRELDAVTVAATKTEVSTDRLERQMAELLTVNRQVALNTHATAVATQRLGQTQQNVTVQVEKTTDRMTKQVTIGDRLIKVFGGLASRTAATGGAFLAVDFLARVAGFNSLMGAINAALDDTAKKFREAIFGAETFAAALGKVQAQTPLGTPELAAFLSQATNKAAAQARVNFTFPGTGIAGYANNPELIQGNAALSGGLQQILFNFTQDLAEIERNRADAASGLKFGIGTTPGEQYLSGRGLGQERIAALASKAQADIDRMVASFARMPAEAEKARSVLAEYADSVKAAREETRKWTANISAATGRSRFERAGLAIATPAALAGIQAGQSYISQQGYLNQAQTGASASPGGNAWMNSVVGASAQYAANLAVIIEQQDKARRNAEQFGQTMAASFEDAIFNARTFEEGLEMISRSLVRVIFNQLVTQQLASSIAGLFPSAKGNVFDSGSVVPFAKGGVVGGPTVFPMRGGKTGLMGEAGPEAIMPLGRDNQGRLGVRGGGNTVVFNITTPDAGSFRRSQRQIMQDARKALGGR